ncbi:hypothetical protein Tco_1321307 [Tanacetum coccineum]
MSGAVEIVYKSDSVDIMNRFETYVKSKDLDLWHVITNGDFQPIEQNPETKLDEVIPFEKQSDELKKRLAKNNEVKMVIYNALPRKEYERIFMCNMAKEIWKNLLITHQGNSQVKDNKIGLLVQQYEQFIISEDESIDSAFARFITIITSLKALDEDLTSLSLDELTGNLKVHEMIIKKDSEIVKAKRERRSLTVRDFKKFFKRRGRFGDLNHQCPKPLKDKNQRAFLGGEECSDSSYFSDENSSIDDFTLDNEYDKLCKMSLKIITKNKHLKSIKKSLENELSELKEKLSTLEKNKGVDDVLSCRVNLLITKF